MKKLLLLLFLIPNLVMAKDYKMYSCPDPDSAKTCNKKCTPDGNDYSIDSIFRVKFKVNVQQQKVLMIEDFRVNDFFYKDGSPIRMLDTKVLENCTVIDKGNWVCESRVGDWGDSLGCAYTERMLNNIFSRYPATYPEDICKVYNSACGK